LHASTASAVWEKLEEHAGAGNGGVQEGWLLQSVGFNFGKRRERQGSDKAGGGCLDASIGRVKVCLVLKYLERGLKRIPKGLDR